LSLRAETEDAWPRCVVALADQRASELSDRRIAVRFLGARSWALLGLSVALAATLALFSTARQTTINLPVEQAVGDQPNAALTSATGQTIRPPGQSPAEADSGRSFSGGVPVPPAATSNGVANSQAGSRSANQAAGEGSGLATTPEKIRSQGEEPSPSRSSENSHASGQVAGGIGASASASPGLSQANGIVSQSGGSSTAPWQSSQWPAEQSRYLQAIQTHKIDPAYAELVRDYFQHP